jgi:hypothetical protein
MLRKTTEVVCSHRDIFKSYLLSSGFLMYRTAPLAGLWSHAKGGFYRSNVCIPIGNGAKPRPGMQVDAR